MQYNSVCHFRERTFEHASDFQFSKKKKDIAKKKYKINKQKKPEPGRVFPSLSFKILKGEEESRYRSYCPIIFTSFLELICVRKREVTCSENFSFQSHSV